MHASPVLVCIRQRALHLEHVQSRRREGGRREAGRAGGRGESLKQEQEEQEEGQTETTRPCCRLNHRSSLTCKRSFTTSIGTKSRHATVSAVNPPRKSAITGRLLSEGQLRNLLCEKETSSREKGRRTGEGERPEARNRIIIIVEQGRTTRDEEAMGRSG
eukprot:752108-Hanusia_phi.AAC.2